MVPSSDVSAASAPIGRSVKVWRSLWMAAATLGIVAVLILLINPRRSVSQQHEVAPPTRPTTQTPAGVEGPSIIRVAADTPLREQLSFYMTKREKVHYPTITVTGSVLARLRAGTGPVEDRWQFSTSELSATYADWVRAKSEVEFAQSQFKKTQELVAAQTEYLDAVVKRLNVLSQDAAVAVAQMKQAQSELIKAQIQGEKDVFTAQSTLRTAQKTKAQLERELSQLGLDQTVFSQAFENRVLVIANVPEGRIADVRVAQACQVRFYGYQNKLFPGHVEALSSAVTSDRRTLRVLFDVEDRENLLKPGMFGEVGLGTDEREAVLVPPKSLLHIGRSDYVIEHESAESWRVVEVKLGELHDDKFEVLGGLDGGHEIVAEGALLLKPLAVDALVRRETVTTTP